MLDVDFDARCGCSSANEALNRDRQDVYDECQDDAESDDVDIKQVVEHVVSEDADLTAMTIEKMWLKMSKFCF